MDVIIDKYDDLGNGITKINNKICFVKKGMPKEKLNVKVIKEKKNYSEAIINDIIIKNERRINSICRYYKDCGGCNLLHMEKEEEINFKKNKIVNYLNRCDYFYETDRYNYRNKVVLHIKNGVFGFYKEKSNDLIEIKYCYIINNKINEVINELNNYSNKTFNGKVTIRVNDKLENIVIIEGNYNNIECLIKSSLIDNLIYNDKVLKGNDYFYMNVSNYQFKVNYNSFFQVNLKGLENIFKILNDYLKDKKINNALDLYSGTSVLGIHISKYANKVTSIEVNKRATLDANQNKKLNNITNLDIINGMVEDYIDKFKDIDLCILDPARRGLDNKTIKYLNIIKSKYLIYIACSIDSLKRDLKFLEEIYNISKVYGVDMFPCTNNCEIVTILERK